MSVNLDFGGITRAYNFERTSSSVNTLFSNYINQIQSIGNSTGPLSTANLQTFNNTMTELKAMLAGLNLSSQGTSTLDSPITAQMAQGIGSLLQLVQSINPNVSLTPNSFTAADSGLQSLQQLQQWRDLYNLGFGDFIQAIETGASTSLRTLQSFVELDYIQSGNTLLSNQMESLNQAVLATRDALTLLQGLQAIKNKATIVANPSSFLSAWDAGHPLIVYTKNGLLFPNTPISANTLTSTQIDKLPGQYTSQMRSQVARLRITVDPTFVQEITNQGAGFIAQLNKVIAELQPITPVGGSAPTLLSELQGILADINAGQPNATNQTIQQKFAWWLLDNYNSTSVTVPGIGTLTNFNPANGGNYQRNLTSAMASAQTLNSAQNTQLQEVLFVFQEFYTSSSKMLSNMANLARMMGQAEAA